MKEYTRELKEKANRDALILSGDRETLEKLTACGLEIPGADHLRAVWSVRASLTAMNPRSTKTQRRICLDMLQKIEKGV